MILNGLGFTNRRLYLTPQFFESKPVSQLFGQEVRAKHFNDHALGKALDEIADYGSSRLFGEIAFEIALENDLLGPLAHLDSTSLSVEGKYNRCEKENAVKLTYGYSKDHRPDLKQVVMSLVVSGKSAMPIWMEPKNGNSSDKKSFDETIKKVRAFQKELKCCPDFKWIADSALYNKDKLLKQNDYLWVSRVPETIAEARHLVERPETEIKWEEKDDKYKIASFNSNYGNREQRWLLVYSKEAFDREKKTFSKKLDKKEEALKKLLWHISNQAFSCEADAKQAAQKLTKKFPYHTIKISTHAIQKYEKSGRPKKGSQASKIAYHIRYELSRNQNNIETFLNRKGRFILATNDLDKQSFPDEEILSEYKQQQCVERGFSVFKRSVVYG